MLASKDSVARFVWVGGGFISSGVVIVAVLHCVELHSCVPDDLKLPGIGGSYRVDGHGISGT